MIKINSVPVFTVEGRTLIDGCGRARGESIVNEQRRVYDRREAHHSFALGSSARHTFLQTINTSGIV